MTKRSLLLFLTALFACASAFAATPKAQNKTAKCDASPYAVILETYYTGHPYRDVNLRRPQTHWNVFTQRIQLGHLQHYSVRDHIGKGKFSKVYKGTYFPKNEPVAVKILVHNKEEKILKEIQILQELKDAPNHLPMRDILREKHQDTVKIGLVFDLFETQNYRESFFSMTPYQVKYLIYETIRSLDYAHSRGIAHRDVKPLNVLMDPPNLQVRVIDWGHSDYYLPGQRYSVRIASLHYKGPELLLNYTMHDYSLDMWSTGTMLAEMSFRKIHFFQAVPEPDLNDPRYTAPENKVRSFRAHLDAIAKVYGTLKLKQYADKFKDWMLLDILNYVGDYKGSGLEAFINDENRHMIAPDLIDLLNKMFVYDHTKRITAKQALLHPYFDEVKKNLADGTHERLRNEYQQAKAQAKASNDNNDDTL